MRMKVETKNRGKTGRHRKTEVDGRGKENKKKNGLKYK